MYLLLRYDFRLRDKERLLDLEYSLTALWDSFRSRDLRDLECERESLNPPSAVRGLRGLELRLPLL